MRVGIHQLHYFPWLGYMNKMAKSDIFIILDDVQLSDSSYMFRHKLLCKNGSEKYITIPFNKKNYMQRKFGEIELNPAVPWQKNHVNFIKDSYSKAPFFKEVWDVIGGFYEKEFETLFDVTNESVMLMREMLDVKTKLIYQSELPEAAGKKNDLVLDLCKEVNADIYLSGNGARKYMDVASFENEGIKVQFQKFSLPEYNQMYSEQFVPGLCGLDMLFNIGIENSKQLLKETLNQKED